MSENTPNIPRGDIPVSQPSEVPEVPKKPQNQFPTEIIDLPSKGHFYPPESPLSKGEIELKYMTAREEDILTSQTLLRKGVVLEKLLESVIVTEGVGVDDLLLGDKNAIYVATRILGYGPQYDVEITCPACNAKQRESINLGQLSTKDIDFESFERGKNLFTFELPVSKRVIEWKLLTQKDADMIEEEMTGLKKHLKSDITYAVTTKLKYVIQSLDGDSNRSKIKSFVDNEFLARDIRAFRKEMDRLTPDVDMTFTFDCASCGAEEDMEVPMGAEFFWPST